MSLDGRLSGGMQLGSVTSDVFPACHSLSTPNQICPYADVSNVTKEAHGKRGEIA